MEKKKTFFDYASEVLIIFGISMIVLNIFCMLFGEDAREFSAIFRLGNKGISIGIVFQFLCVSVLITLYRILFFTDTVIKQMSIVLRTVCMLTAAIATISVFIIVFKWFPVNMPLPWIMFLLSFGISFVISLAVMSFKEKTENKLMAEALKKLKQGDNSKMQNN